MSTLPRYGVAGRVGRHSTADSYTCTQTSLPGNPPPAKPQNPEASVVAASDRRLQSKKKNLGRERGSGFPGGEGGTHTLDYGKGEGGQQHRALLTPTAADTSQPLNRLPATSKNPETSVHPAFASLCQDLRACCLR